VLAAVLHQLTGPEPQPKSTEAAASVDRGQLPVIAHQDHLGLRLFGVLEEAAQFAAAHHAGLIDHQHRAGVQLLAAPPRSLSSRSQVATDSSLHRVGQRPQRRAGQRHRVTGAEQD
jgi:hypothetical protein